MSRSSIPPGAIATSPTIFSFASAPWQSGRRPEEKFRQAAKSFYGEGHRGRTVRIVDHLPKTRQVIETIASVYQAREPPPLVFSKDCPACDFLSRRGALAVERDDLRLLGPMTGKEQAKSQKKGISDPPANQRRVRGWAAAVACWRNSVSAACF